jgi:hypothetical protein
MARRAPRRFLPGNLAQYEVQLESRELLAQLPAGLTIQEWSGGLTQPTTFVSDKNNWIYVGQLDGTITRVSTADGSSQFLLKLPAENVDSRGLYSIALDPNFAENGELYAFYYALSSTGRREARVSRIDLNTPGRPETVLMRIPIKSSPEEHHGGALEVNNGFIYFAIGDLEQPGKVKDLNTPNGKVFRIRTNGTIPHSNPFYHRSNGLGRAVWATGFREPFNSSLDPASGVYLIHDVGSYQAEEIDQVTRGGNYGWPYYEGNRFGEIKGTPAGRIVWPIYYYRNKASDIIPPKKIAVSANRASSFELRPQDEGTASMGGTFYDPTGPITNSALKALIGDYLFADLSAGWIDTLDFRTRQSSQFASNLGTQILNIDYTNDGRIFVLARGKSPADMQIKVIEPASGQ